jgi:spoIIIJ-associated protein
MTKEKQIEKIKNIVENFCEKTTVSFNNIEIDNDMDLVRIVINSDESGILIGKEGETLRAINHLIKNISYNQIFKDIIDGQEKIDFFIDINDYQGKMLNNLKKEANEASEKVKFFKKSVELRAMNPYERMIIHSFLSKDPDVRTESDGEDKFRRIVIKLK